MENHQNLGPLYAAHHHSDNMEHTEPNLMRTDLVSQLEWEILFGDANNTMDTQTYPSPFHEHPEEIHFPEPETVPSSLAQSLQASPATMTDSILETPPMPDYELPPDLVALWSDEAWDSIPDFETLYPLDTSFDWPLPETWMGNGLDCSASTVPTGSIWDDSFPQMADSPNLNLTLPLPAPPPPAASPESSAKIEKPTTDTHSCATCAATFTSITKLNTHTYKHTKPFRCTAPDCDYAGAEKKSLQRHVAARAKWDEGHRVAAEGLGVKDRRYRCERVGCEYVTIREDNLRRHATTCLA